jgi:hypothetical protein
MTRALVVLAAAAVLAAGAAPAGASPRDACVVAGTATLAAGALVRVYAHRGRVVACVRATGRRALLGPTLRADTCFPDLCFVSQVRVAGALVAYGSELLGRFDLIDHVIVRDVVRGRVLVEAPDALARARDGDACLDGAGRLEGIGPLSDLVLRADGAVAWIALRLCGAGPTGVREVHALVPGVSRRLLGAGTAIASASLTLDGDVVRWRSGGQARSAALDGG